MADGTKVAHAYDAFGNRVQTGVTPSSGGAASITNMLVDTGAGPSQVVAETDAANTLIALYVRAGDELLAVMRPGGAGMWTTHYVHADGLGSVRVITDETGMVLDTRGYEAFGTKNVEAGNESLPYGFAAEALDATSHLAYHRARWMDSRVGRFAGMDKFGGVMEATQTLQKYAYVTNDPIDLTDPSGLLSPQSLVVGSLVHEQIGEDWRAGLQETTLNGRIDNVAIVKLISDTSTSRKDNWLLKFYFGVSTLARPDLIAEDEHAIYEIKSIDEFGQGQLKLGLYLDLLNALDPTSGWRAGLDNEYLPRWSISLQALTGLTYNISVSPPQSGVITYVWNQYQKVLQNVGVAVAVGLGVGFGASGGAFGGVGGLY